MRHKLVIVLLAFLPIWIHGQVTKIDGETFVNFAYPKFLLLVVISGFLFLTTKRITKNFFLLLFLLLLIISCIKSIFLQTSVLGYINLRTGLITYFCCAVVYTASIGLKSNTILLTLSIYIVVDAIIGIAAYLKFNTFHWLSPIIIGHFVNTKDTVYYATVLSNFNYSSGLGAACYIMFAYYSTSWYFQLCAILSAVIVLISLSTVGFVTILLLLPALIYLTPRRRILIYHATILAICYIFFYCQNHTILDNTFLFNNFTLSDRGIIWTNCLKMILQAPFFGHGLDTYPYYAYVTFDQHMTTPHNFYLALAFGAGLPVLISFGTFLASAIKPKLAPGIFLGLCAMLIQFVTNDAMIETLPILFILCGCLTQYEKLSNNKL